MIGKKAGGGDYLAFLVFVIGLIFLFVLSVFVIHPSIGGKKANEIKVEMEDLSDNLLLYGFLRQNINDKSMADIIALAYTNDNYKDLLKEETTKIMENIQKDVNFNIEISGKEGKKTIEVCNTKCKGEKKEFTAILPSPNKEIIDFKLILYET